MITFFTTTKDFNGNTKIAQVNAIQSWQASVEGAEVIVFGKSDGVGELAEKLGFIHQPEIRVSEQGTPYVNDMFHQVARLAHYDICCFINADIIICSEFAESLIAIHSLLRDRYLIVGQRQDIDLKKNIIFDNEWESDLKQQIAQHGKIHPPMGSDFFAFPKGQYHAGNMPILLVGRGGWDLWMIYNARKRGLKVTDLSPSTMPIHQNHDYSHRKMPFNQYAKDTEALLNLSQLPKDGIYDYTLFACNYMFKNGKIRRSFARGKLRTFIHYELNLRNRNMLFRLIRKILQHIRIFPKRT